MLIVVLKITLLHDNDKNENLSQRSSHLGLSLKWFNVWYRAVQISNYRLNSLTRLKITNF